MLVKDGKVAALNIEPPGAFGVSSADHLLGQIA
jgi:peroxiredoxin